MREMEFNKKERQKLIIAGTFCLIAIISVIGYTYSYFTATATNTGTITGTAASASLSLDVEKVAPDTDKALVPQLDSAIASAVVGSQGNCVDDNLNAVCQVYQVTVTNTSTMIINVDGLLELNAGNNPNLKWALISSYTDGMTTKPTVTSNINSYVETTITTNEEYIANQTKTYYIVVWISETGYVQSDKGSFTGTVIFNNHVKGNASKTLAYLQSLGFTDEVSENSPTTFTSTATTDEGLLASEDDLGTSYYFRGDVENNYVKFGKNSSNQDMYWRIIRINGDGTIRMIYDGTSAHANGESSTDRQVGTSAYNTNSADNGFVGYMNGTTDGTNFPNGTANSISYTEAHTNLTNSTIKTFLEGTDTVDGWYKDNIVDTGYSSYVVDAIYCNDRTLTPSTNNNYEFFLGTFLGMTLEEIANENQTYATGYGKTEVISLYGIWGYKSIFVSDMSAWLSITPSLKCERKDDRFTVGTKVEDVEGNNKNRYPVGLITADEIIFAGGYSSSNSNYYLYTGNYYWTASPAIFCVGYADVSLVRSNGSAGVSDNVHSTNGTVRPVISLGSEVLKYGTGTDSDPFRLEPAI